MALRTPPRARLGVWVGLAVGLVGVALYFSLAALATHAARGAQVAGGESFSFTGPYPVHVTGIVEPGDDGTPPATCKLTSGSGTDTVEVGTRENRLDSIGTGRYLRAGQGERITVSCDRRVAVSTGQLVVAYPLAESTIVGAVLFAVTTFGFVYAWRSHVAGSRTRHGGDGRRPELGSRPADQGRGAARPGGWLGKALLLLLVVVGMTMLQQRDDGVGMLFISVAVALGLAARVVKRWRRSRTTVQAPPSGGG